MKLMELEATLSLNTTGFETGVKGAKDELSGMGEQFDQLQRDANDTNGIMQGALGHALGDFFSSMTQEMISAAFEFARGSIDIASSMEEVQNVVDTTFGADAGKINAWARTTTEAYGVGELAALKFAGTMGATLNGLGIESSKLDDMSMSLVGLAGDMASFYNLDSATAFQKILSGMTGEMEPLKSLGIVMSVANLEAHALAMGIETSWSKMDTATQTIVRYDYLMEQTANAQGDFAKTQDSYANQMRLLEENIKSLQAALGESLLPVMTDIVSFFNSIFGGAESGADAIENVGTSLGVTYATIDNTTANALALVEALKQMEEAGINTSEEQSAWNGLLKELSSTLPGIAELIDDTTGSIKGGTDALAAYVTQWQTTQREIAIASALQEAQAEVAAKQQKVAEKEWEYKIATMTDQDTEAREAELYAMYGDYLRNQYGWTDSQLASRAWVDVDLVDRYEAGDAYASYIVKQLEAIWDSDNTIEAAKSEVLAAQAELADAQAKFDAMYATLEYMSGGTPAETQEESKKQDAGMIAQLPNIDVHVYLDGTEISAELIPGVTGAVMSAISWQVQNKVGG